MKVKLLIITVSLILAACGGGGGSQTSSSVIPDPIDDGDGVNQEDTLIALDSVTAGLCANIVQDMNGIEFLDAKACSDAHELEVAGSFSLSELGEEYPGSIEIDRRAHKGCRPVFEAHTGEVYTGTVLGIETITPSRSSWSNGDTEVLCLVVNADRSDMLQTVSQ